MNFQSCEYCGTKFKYITILKAFFSGNGKYLDCEKCGKEYKLTRDYHRIISIVVLLPIFTWGLLGLWIYPLDGTLVFALSISYVITVVALIPFIVKYAEI